MTGAAPGRLTPSAYALLALLCLALYLPGFTGLPPFDRDESRFAQASSQMLESRDFVDIRFQDEARHKKPVGIYWLQAAATHALGADSDRRIWTYRLPSLAGAAAAVLLTAWAGTRLFGVRVGVGAAILLASCVVLGVEARMAKTDAVLLATIVAAQGALGAIYLGRDGPRPGLGLPLAFWCAIGFGALIKGPVTAMVPFLTILALAAWERKIAWAGRLRPLPGVLVVALIAAPWLIAITLKTNGAFFAESVGHDMMGKVAGGQEGKGLPPGFYLLTSLITFAPWAFLAIAALPWVWRNRNQPAVRFCVCWIVPTWLAFEAVPTKLLHYTLPTFPALAFLAVRALTDGYDRAGGGRWAFRAGIGLGAFGFTALVAAVALVPWLVDGRVDPWAIAIALPALTLFALAVRFSARGDMTRTIAAGLGAAVLVQAATYAAVLPSIDGLWVSRSAAQAVARHRLCPDPIVASAGYNEPSLVFLLGRATRFGDGSAAARHLAEGGACALALVEKREQASFAGTFGADAAVPLETITGYNYNNGRRLVMTLYGPAR